MGKRYLGYVLVALLAVAAQPAFADDSFKFEAHGFVGASMYVQTNPDFLLNGQGALLLRAQNNQITTGFDARESRLTLSVTGPAIFGGNAIPKALIETDFFGLNSPGTYGEVSALSRLRIAYAELNFGGDTIIRMGQEWELIWANAPVTLGHMTFSPAWFAGLTGWREPGFTVFHKIPLSDSTLEASFQVLKSDWSNPLGFGLSSSNDLNVDAGQLSGIPGFDARLKWSDEHNDMTYIAGHWNRVDGSNANHLVYTKAGDSLVFPGRNWDVALGKIGGKYLISDFTLQGEAYYGMNTAPLFGEQATFYTANNVHEGGFWFQAGYSFTPELSLWGLYGTTRSNTDDVTAAGGGPFSNTVAGGMLQYKTGGFAFGPEIYHVETKSTLPSGQNAPDGIMDGIQFMLSGLYFF